MPSKRARVYRVKFFVSDERKDSGSILVAEKSVEMAISAAGKLGNGRIVIHSVSPLFDSDEEERDFFAFLASQGGAKK